MHFDVAIVCPKFNVWYRSPCRPIKTKTKTECLMTVVEKRKHNCETDRVIWSESREETTLRVPMTAHIKFMSTTNWPRKNAASVEIVCAHKQGSEELKPNIIAIRITMQHFHPPKIASRPALGLHSERPQDWLPLVLMTTAHATLAIMIWRHNFEKRALPHKLKWKLFPNQHQHSPSMQMYLMWTVPRSQNIEYGWSDEKINEQWFLPEHLN